MRRWMRLVAIAAVAAVPVLGAGAAIAQPPDGAATGPAGVDLTATAPYIDANTTAVVRVDPTRFSLDEGLTFLKRVLPPDVPIEPAGVGATAGVLAQWKATGAGEAYLVVSALRPTSPPLLVIPLPATAEDRDLRMLLKFSPWSVIERKGDVLLAGDAATIEAAKTMVGSPRPEFVAALEHIGPATISAAVALSNDHRRVLREMLPPAPEAFGGAAANKLIDDVKWIAASIAAPPNANVQLVLKTDDAEIAKRIAALAKESLEKFAATPDLQREIPHPEALVEVFTPKAEETLVVWRLTQGDEAYQQLIALIAQPIAQAREAAARSNSMNNLKQLGLACHNYLSVKKTFPPGASLGAKGERLLSWRVHILPYIEQAPLYQQFHLDEPWDSEHNKKLISKMPELYRHPSSKLPTELGKTNYLGVSGEGAMMGEPGGMTINAMTDGTSNTILALEVPDDQAVIWTKPQDWELNAKSPLHDLGGPIAGGFNALFADGAVQFISKTIDAKKFFGLLTAKGGEVVER